ncbi:uncharacterized protein LOC131584628 [Poecile atricapillus]|uniref:uncharacterized protein LOC131584628 n=1 Tax=Poecile atricapillus TaxID=48891 RepID=UPI002738EFB3|nr:uncharacterized protein LOC131584628 [Poecile atricapillus]
MERGEATPGSRGSASPSTALLPERRRAGPGRQRQLGALIGSVSRGWEPGAAAARAAQPRLGGGVSAACGHRAGRVPRGHQRLRIGGHHGPGSLGQSLTRAFEQRRNAPRPGSVPRAESLPRSTAGAPACPGQLPQQPPGSCASHPHRTCPPGCTRASSSLSVALPLGTRSPRVPRGQPQTVPMSPTVMLHVNDVSPQIMILGFPP